jgi:hypothetical protein
MLYYPDGTLLGLQRLRVTVSCAPGISRPDEASPNGFSLHRKICAVVLEKVRETRSVEQSW